MALLGVALVAGCGTIPQADTDAQAALKAMVVATPGKEFSRRIDTVQGVEAAARASSADPTGARRTMLADGLRLGWARTWVAGSEDVQVLVLELEDQFKARDLAAFELREVAGGVGVTSYPDPGVPGSGAYTFVGRTRAGQRQVFCQGSWFIVAQFAVNVTDCADTPRYSNLMLAVTRQEYELISTRLGLPIAPVPSPQS